MMILEKIKKDQVNARKEKNTIVTKLLTTLIGEIEIIAKNEQRMTSDDDCIKVLNKTIKNNISTMEVIDSDNIKHTTLKNENTILESYLPQQLTQEELTESITHIIKEEEIDSMKMMGKVMSTLKQKHGSTYDGALASKLVKEMLSEL